MKHARNLILWVVVVTLWIGLGSPNADGAASCAAKAAQDPGSATTGAKCPTAASGSVVIEDVVIEDEETAAPATPAESAEPKPAPPAATPATPAPTAAPAPAVAEPVAGEPTSLRCKYKVGDVERIQFASDRLYKNWVEMPEKPASQTTSNFTKQELVLKRQVESVNPDGSAVMKVTFESVNVSLDISTTDKKTSHTYSSNAEGTTSTFTNQPKPELAGSSYQIEIAADSTVKAVLGLEELRKKLNLPDDAKGNIPQLLSEDSIKMIHERDFVRNCPDKVASSTAPYVLPDSYEKLLPLPDPMIKAQAMKNTYKVGPVAKSQKADIVSVVVTGKAIHSVPEDFPQPPKLSNFGALLIKNSSDMQDLNIVGAGTFDLSNGRVLLENTAVECMLVLLEENAFGGVPEGRKSTGGKMFTEIKLHQSIKVLP